jgi:lysophospholipase L1-like esterase
MLPVVLLLALRQSGPVTIPASDPHIRYIGRWDFRDPSGPRAEWPASEIEIRFRGQGMSATFSPSPDYWVEEVDDKVKGKIQFLDTLPHVLAASLPGGFHTIRLVKATEAFVGIGQPLSFSTDATTRLLIAPPGRRRLEVIGDSISCGYGDEGANEKEHFKPETENAYLSYGAIAARELHMQFTDIAWSGRKMWPDNTIPAIYDLALPTDPESIWRFGMRGPDVIVINLATNDFGKGVPEEKGWTTAYSDFIARVRTHAPSARVYLAAGPMMNDAWPPNTNALTVLRRYLKEIVDDRAAAGDRNCAIIDFGAQDAARDGLGSDYHPSLATHKRMAEKLVETIKADQQR